MKSSDSVPELGPVQHGAKRSNTFTHFFSYPTGAISPLRTKRSYNEPCPWVGGGGWRRRLGAVISCDDVIVGHESDGSH